MSLPFSPATLPLTDARSEVLRAIMRSFGEDDASLSRPGLRPAWALPAATRRRAGSRRRRAPAASR